MLLVSRVKCCSLHSFHACPAFLLEELLPLFCPLTSSLIGTEVPPLRKTIIRSLTHYLKNCARHDDSRHFVPHGFDSPSFLVAKHSLPTQSSIYLAKGDQPPPNKEASSASMQELRSRMSAGLRCNSVSRPLLEPTNDGALKTKLTLIPQRSQKVKTEAPHPPSSNSNPSAHTP